ncbi:head-tail connector protein [Caulobacter sp. NIBR2454]|uniref:head-tail connector protein n=1 Tax=Caulobacter sp. NIBR2454 TaxID=3015996 RepID=UPI0022B638D8|nr:head-tail connector protein [Caulobacter sp. NIBR2454]
MTQPVSVAEARAFLRVTDDAEDGLIGLMIEAAAQRIAAVVSVAVDADAPAAVRLAVMRLVAHAYEQRESGEPPMGLVEAWIAPWRAVRL